MTKVKKAKGGMYNQRLYNNRNRSRSRNNRRRNSIDYDRERLRNLENPLNALKMSDQEPDAETDNELTYACTKKGFFSCKGNCNYIGTPGLGGKCVPAPLDNSIACHKRKPAECVYPCRTFNVTGSRSRPNCKHFPIKNVAEIANYVKELSRTKYDLLKYFQLMNDKNEEIQVWIKDSIGRLTLQENQQRVYLEEKKRIEVELKDPEERNKLKDIIVENEVILDKIVRNIKELEDLLRNIVTIYTGDKDKDKLLEEKVAKEEQLMNTRADKSGRLGYGANNRRSRNSIYRSSSRSSSSRSSRSITRRCSGKLRSSNYNSRGEKDPNGSYRKDKNGLCINSYYGGNPNKKTKKKRNKK